MGKSKQHLNDRVYVYAVLWLISYAGSLMAIKKLNIEKEVGILLTIIPFLAFSLFIYKFYRSVFFLDEVQIKIQMESAVIGFTLGLLLLMTLGLLDLVVTLNREDWSYRHLVPYFTIFYFIGLFISKRKYNFENEKQD